MPSSLPRSRQQGARSTPWAGCPHNRPTVEAFVETPWPGGRGSHSSVVGSPRSSSRASKSGMRAMTPRSASATARWSWSRVMGWLGSDPPFPFSFQASCLSRSFCSLRYRCAMVTPRASPVPVLAALPCLVADLGRDGISITKPVGELLVQDDRRQAVLDVLQACVGAGIEAGLRPWKWPAAGSRRALRADAEPDLRVSRYGLAVGAESSRRSLVKAPVPASKSVLAASLGADPSIRIARWI